MEAQNAHDNSGSSGRGLGGAGDVDRAGGQEGHHEGTEEERDETKGEAGKDPLTYQGLETTAQAIIDEEGQRYGTLDVDGQDPRDERAHPPEPPQAARRKVRGRKEGRQESGQSERVRSPGDQLATLAGQLLEIADVLSGQRQWCVIEADCVELMRLLPDSSVAHVIADPPYSAEVHARSIRRTYLPDVADQPCRRTRSYEFGFAPLTRSLARALTRHYFRVSARWVIAFSDCETADWWRSEFGDSYVRQLVWVKDRAMPQISGDRPGSRWESMMLGHAPGRKRWNARPDGGDGNVWQYPVVANCSGHRQDRIHTAQKPLDLMLDLLESFTDPGDIILDSHAGSGTTGVAALRLGRRCILIEQKPEYAQLCIDRMKAEDQNQDVHHYRAGQTALWQK